MTTVDEFVDLQIEVKDKVPSKPNFGTPLIACYHTAWVDRVREYSEADDLLDDGFTESSPAYKMATALKAQSPSPATFKVGRLANAYTHTVTLEMLSAVEGDVVEGEVNDTPIEYEIPAAATLTTVATAVELLVEAVTGITSSSAVATITAVSAAGDLGEYSFGRNVKIKDTTADPGITADLNAIKNEDNDWYGLLVDCNSEAIATAAAVWTEANRKIFVPVSSDWDIVDAGQTTDLASDLVALALTRTAGIYHRGIGDGDDQHAAAWLGGMLAFDPGTITWAFKPLATVEADDLRAGELSALAAKNWSYYSRVNGANVTFEGRTPSGRFIDVTHFIDWLHAEIQADVYSLLINNPKVPYTTTGIELVKNAVLGALRKGQARGGLADDTQPTCTVPTITDTDAADRANRILRNVKFTARLAGALHHIVIRGTVSV
jgi:hypothetical protein